MPRTLLAIALLVAAPATHAGPPDGRVEGGDGRFEILSRPLRAGDRVDLPEGYLIVEESGPEDGAVGSFGIIPAESFAAAAPASSAGPGDASGPGDGASPAPLRGEGKVRGLVPVSPSCTAERAAYLAELWRASGIDVKDPAALLEGLEAGASGPAAGFFWFAAATDAFRPLTWSSELRARADALVRCVRDRAG